MTPTVTPMATLKTRYSADRLTALAVALAATIDRMTRAPGVTRSDRRAAIAANLTALKRVQSCLETVYGVSPIC